MLCGRGRDTPAAPPLSLQAPQSVSKLWKELGIIQPGTQEQGSGKAHWPDSSTSHTPFTPGGLPENGEDSDKVSSQPGSAAEGLPLPRVLMLISCEKQQEEKLGWGWDRAVEWEGGPGLPGVPLLGLFQPLPVPQQYTSHVPRDPRSLYFV